MTFKNRKYSLFMMRKFTTTPKSSMKMLQSKLEKCKNSFVLWVTVPSMCNPFILFRLEKHYCRNKVKLVTVVRILPKSLLMRDSALVERVPGELGGYPKSGGRKNPHMGISWGPKKLIWVYFGEDGGGVL